MVPRCLASTATRRCSSWRKCNNSSPRLLHCGDTTSERRRRAQQSHHSSSMTATTRRATYYSTAARIAKQRSIPRGHLSCNDIILGIGKRPVTSFLFGRDRGREQYLRPWHDPEFMRESSPEEAEKWLLSLIQSTRKAAEEERIRSSNASNIPIVHFGKDYALDAAAYLRVLEAYARSNKGGSPQKAEYWLGVLERHYAAASDLFKETYGIHAKVGRVDGGAVDERNKTRGAASPSIRNSSSAAVHDRPKSQNRNEVQRGDATAIVRRLQPTVECYNAIIEAWSDDKDLISVVRSRRWLSKLEDDAKSSANGNYSSLYTPLRPNARSYDLYLCSCSRGLGKHRKLHRERAEEAREILEYRLSTDAPVAIRPTTESFNYVIRAWTRCRKEMDVPLKVMHLVLMMERIKKEFLLAEEKRLGVHEDDWSWKGNVSPNTKTYTMAIDSWIIKAGLKAQQWSSSQLSKRNTLKQKAMSRRGNNGNPQIIEATPGEDERQGDGTKEMEKAETILKYIRDLDAIGQTDVRATVIGYNILLSGWARLANEIRPDVPLLSEKLLHEMIAMAERGDENAAPDATSFNAVIKAWGRTKRPNSADRCEYWLRKMVDGNHARSSRGEKNFMAMPNVATYNLVMDAHLSLSDPERVQDMLVEMDATNGLIPPNNESFSKVIRAWLDDELNNRQYGLSGSSIENAYNWLSELLQREKRGDVDLAAGSDLFSAILKTAARTEARGENLLTVGQMTFWAMKGSRFQPDHLAYTWLLEIGLKVLSSPDNGERREKLITTILDQCCKDGMLSSKFLKTLSNGPFYDEGWTEEESVRVCKELVGEPPFPTTWSRNLKDGQKHQQPQAEDLVRKH